MTENKKDTVLYFSMTVNKLDVNTLLFKIVTEVLSLFFYLLG